MSDSAKLSSLAAPADNGSAAGTGTGGQITPDLIKEYMRQQLLDLTAFLVVVALGSVITWVFIGWRFVRRFKLRQPVTLRPDENGQIVVDRGGRVGRVLGLPGLMFGKLGLRSFYRVGVPGGGTLFMIVVWIGGCLFATLLLSGFKVDAVADRLG